MKPRRRVDGWSILHGTGEVLITLGCILLLFASTSWSGRTSRRTATRPTYATPGAELDEPSERPFGQAGGVAGDQPVAGGDQDPAGACLRGDVHPGARCPLGQGRGRGRRPGRPQGHDRALPADGAAGRDRQLRGGRPPGDQRRAAARTSPTSSTATWSTSGPGTLGTPTGSRSTEIVAPTAVEVLLPVPGKPGVKPTEALITITTCNPRWASFERWIISGVLTDTRPETEGPPPGLDVKG